MIMLNKKQIEDLIFEINKLPNKYSFPLMNLLRKQTGWVADPKRCP